MFPTTFLGALVSALWNGSTQNEEKNSKLKESLRDPVSQNQTTIDRYINEYKNATLAAGNQTPSSESDKKVYEVEVYQSPLKDNASSSLHKLGIFIYKIVTADWSHSKKPRMLQIESAKNKSSTLSLDSNQIANLVAVISSEKKVGELAVISSDQSLISSVSNSILTRYNQGCLALNEIFTIKNPFSFSMYPPKEELKKSLENQALFNQTRVDNYKIQYGNRTEFNNGTNSSEIDGIFDRLVQSGNIKLSDQHSLTNDVYKNFGSIAAFTVVLGGVLCTVYQTICQQRKNKTLKKFKLFSKKALIHHRFEKIQKENLKVKELKQQAELKKSSLLVSEINIEKQPSQEKRNVEIIKGKQSSTSNEFLRALQGVKKLFESDSEPLNLSKIYQFIVL